MSRPLHQTTILALLALALAAVGCAGSEIPLPTAAAPPAASPAPTSIPTLPPTTALPATLVAAVAPAATLPSPTAALTSTAASGTYIVVEGDTLWAIAARFGLTPEHLAAANPGINPNLLHPGDVLVIPDPNLPPPTSPPSGAVSSPAPSPTVAHTSAPSGNLPDFNNLTGLTDHARQIFALGQSLGNRADVFSKVGDSITLSSVFLNPIGLGLYDLHDYGQLQAVIDYYDRTAARGEANSFSNTPLAAKVSWRADGVLNPDLADHSVCLEGETPLACEYRLVQPAVALIMLGTNDVPSSRDSGYEANLRQVIELTLARGIIPVLSTIPPLFRTGLEGRSEALNVIVVRLAQEYDIPLWDYWAALQGLPNSGIASDGVHPTSAPVGHNADFTPQYLQYGMVVRNLNALYVLDVIWRQVLQP